MELTQDQLRKVLYYNRATGDFHWRFGTKNREPWRRAGTRTGAGYEVIHVGGKLHYAHRLAVLYTTGSFPSAHTDHKNGSRAQNAVDNLRPLTASLNGHNRQGANRNSLSGVLGVQRRGNRYRARIMVARKGVFLGSFLTEAEAIHAVQTAKAQLLKEPT